jgi:hypothetical protein
MDYGQRVQNMGAAAISAASGCRQQLLNMGYDIKVGITSMIGINDTPDEVTWQWDARNIVNWALNTPYIGLVSFWESGRDHDRWDALYASSQISQWNYEFHSIFMGAQSSAPSRPATVPDWNDCPSSTSQCSDSTFKCCFGSAADLAAGRHHYN